MNENNEVFVHGMLFPLRLKFASKAGAYPSEASFRCSTLGSVSDLARKHQVRLDRENTLAYSTQS